jgi:hypothetical protein
MHTSTPRVLAISLVALYLVLTCSVLTPGASAQQPAPQETPAVVVDGSSAETLLGKPVQTAKGEDLGRVVDVIVDRTGMVRAAIVDFGGFLGVGTRKIAVDWRVLRFAPANAKSNGLEKLIADLSRDQLRKAPVYKEGEPIVIMGATAPSPPAPAADTPPSPAPPAPGPDSPAPPKP